MKQRTTNKTKEAITTRAGAVEGAINSRTLTEESVVRTTVEVKMLA
jgi:hypothetical protein